MTKEKQKSAKFVAMILAKEVLEKYGLKPADIMRGMVVVLNPELRGDPIACDITKKPKSKELNLDGECST